MLDDSVCWLPRLDQCALRVVEFFVNIFFYTSFLVSTGSVFAGISSLAIGAFFSALVVLLLEQFGAATLYQAMYQIIALPLPVIFPKILNLVSAPVLGAGTDTLSRLLKKRRRLFSVVGGAFNSLFWSVNGIVLYFTIGLPGTEHVPKALLTPLGLGIMVVVLSLLGGISGYLAFVIYSRIKNTTVVRRIQR